MSEIGQLEQLFPQPLLKLLLQLSLSKWPTIENLASVSTTMGKEEKPALEYLSPYTCYKRNGSPLLFSFLINPKFDK